MNDLLYHLERAFPSDDVQIRRLVRLPDDRPTVFVGDIHGDQEAVERVLSTFPSPSHTVVFLGDIVDRGPDSLGALRSIVQAKCAAPDAIVLLMGNHEAYGVCRFSPADFWESLSTGPSDALARRLARLPLAAWHRSTGLLAVHGGLPEVPSLEAIDDIELGSEPWRALTWGDWIDEDSDAPGTGHRPVFGRMTFERRSERLQARVLVRSHQPSAPTYLFGDRCLTLFTSNAYGNGVRQVARWTPERRIDTARDLELIEI
jgi:predicted MPP superfamily phosphohydrolase